ncbi:cysteine proteinase [Backusella circina FSU 941]|nr:cysteine proteinase [Backusella circina FSU 941]
MSGGMYYYKQLLGNLTNSTFVNSIYKTVRGSSSTNDTQIRDRVDSPSIAQAQPAITNTNTPSDTSSPVDIITLDDSDDEDDSVQQNIPDPRLYLNYNNQVLIYNNDLNCLEPNKWLNDSIMEYCYTELYQAALEANRRKASNIYISNSFIFTKLQEAKSKNMDLYEVGKKWIKDVDLFEKKLWLIPVCEGNHWYLIAVTNIKHCTSKAKCSKKCRIFLLDSLNMVSTTRLNLITDFLKATAQANGLEFKQPITSRLHVPQQNNSYDCGLYVLYFIKTIIGKQNRMLKNTSNELKRSTWKRRNFPSRTSILASLRLYKV